jgi:hypothetical protein
LHPGFDGTHEVDGKAAVGLFSRMGSFFKSFRKPGSKPSDKPEQMALQDFYR